MYFINYLMNRTCHRLFFSEYYLNIWGNLEDAERWCGMLRSFRHSNSLRGVLRKLLLQVIIA